MTDGTPTGSPHFPSIDILRGFAAVSVVVYHVIEHMGWTSFPVTGPLLWFRIGWMGVDLFFVISGFVIALSAFALIDKRGLTGYRLPFAQRRLARIVPLHYLTCLIFLVVVGVGTPGIAENILSHLGFFHNLNWRWSGALNGPNWSVAVEMQFYLLILLLAGWLRDCRWWLIPLLFVTVAWIWRYGAIMIVPIDQDVGPFYLFWASTQLPGTLDEFAVGILLARLVRSPFGASLLTKMQAQPLWGICAATVAVWLTLALFWPRASFWDHTGMIIFWRSLLAATFGLVILVACTIQGNLFLWLTAPLRYLGTISYGIYLWHLMVILTLKEMSGFDPALTLLVTLAATFVLASSSWHLFEKLFLGRR